MALRSNNSGIGADGTAINGVPRDLLNNITFNTYGSAFFGENAGSGLSEETNRNNTYIGTNSGSSLLTKASYFNTFIGANSGKNIGNNSSSNIIIGTNHNGLQNQQFTISIGLENYTRSQSLTYGHNNINNGQNNVIAGKDNNLQGNDILTLGDRNTLKIDKSIVIGNDNNIENTEYGHSNCTIIGHDISLYSNYNLNIDNTFVKYDDFEVSETIFIGFDNKYDHIKTVIGYDQSSIEIENILNSCNNDISLYVHKGLIANNIALGSITSNNSISLGITSNITSNVQYYLPDYPESTHNMFLTLKDDGEMFWKHLQIGSSILTTDDLPEGSTNLYFNDTAFDERFEMKTSDISLDNIQNGVNNNYIKNGIFNRDLVIFGTLTVNKLRVLGVNMKQDTTFDKYINNLVESKVFEIEKTIDDNVSLLNTKINNTSNYIEEVSNNTRFFIKTNFSSLHDIGLLPYSSSVYTNIRYRSFNISLTKNNILEYSLTINVNYNGIIVTDINYQILYTQNNLNTLIKYVSNIVVGLSILDNKIGFYNNTITLSIVSGYEITMMSI